MRTTLVRLHTGVSYSRLIVTIPLCEDPAVGTRCACGGLLAFIAGRFQHVEACLACYANKEPCPDTSRHRSCFLPEPVACPHAGCAEPVSVETPCTELMTREDDAVDGVAPTCCGCCWQLDDDLTGRIYWPADYLPPLD